MVHLCASLFAIPDIYRGTEEGDTGVRFFSSVSDTCRLKNCLLYRSPPICDFMLILRFMETIPVPHSVARGSAATPKPCVDSIPAGRLTGRACITVIFQF